jgi:hypothetical protein
MVIALTPADAGTLLRLSELHLMRGDYSGALRTIRTLPSQRPSDKAVAIYLECMAKKILDMDSSRCEDDLKGALEGYIDISWSFNPIELWLETANLDKDKKAFIRAKTDLIKKKVQQP